MLFAGSAGRTLSGASTPQALRTLASICCVEEGCPSAGEGKSAAGRLCGDWRSWRGWVAGESDLLGGHLNLFLEQVP